MVGIKNSETEMKNVFDGLKNINRLDVGKESLSMMISQQKSPKLKSREKRLEKKSLRTVGQLKTV